MKSKIQVRLHNERVAYLKVNTHKTKHQLAEELNMSAAGVYGMATHYNITLAPSPRPIHTKEPQILKAIMSNPKITAGKIARDLSMQYGSVTWFLKKHNIKLGACKPAAKKAVQPQPTGFFNVNAHWCWL